MTNTPTIRTVSTSRRRGRSSLVLAAAVLALAAALSSCGSGGSAGADQAKAQSGGTKTATEAKANTDASAGESDSDSDSDSGTIDSCTLLSEDQLSAIIGSAVTVSGPSIEVARGRSCTYTFAETGNSILDEGTIDIAAWHGSEFFSPGIGPARGGIGEAAQDDSDHGIVMFKVGDDVVQVHVISPDHKADSVQIASAAANRVAGAARSS